MKNYYFVHIGFEDQGIHIIAKSKEEAKTKFLKRIKITDCKCEDTISPFQLVIK
jgi:hypothetical protein